jgi:hypothetical protein
MGQVIPNQHMNVYFSMEGGMRIMNKAQAPLCIRELYE